ncbi:DUF3653 domain-containing protein [Stenotrophomonas maltophilia]|uniref:DUF3653 domain-containing protein n=1 Tax=Stenotrophomonas maltophilia TaxID=40324 RepID=UPI003CCFE1FB
MSKIDPHDRIDLTGPWAGFGFQAGHMFTPEGHQLEPCDMTWWSLTCNIAREWRLMMAEARTDLAERSAPASTGSATVNDQRHAMQGNRHHGTSAWPGKAVLRGLRLPGASEAIHPSRGRPAG